MQLYGQLVIGAPGAGKSTYCTGMVQLLQQMKRPVVCVNLDPANDLPPFRVDIDIRELITGTKFERHIPQHDSDS